MSQLTAKLKGPATIFSMLACALVIWELCVRILQIKPILLPPPSRIWTEFIGSPAYFMKETGQTFLTTVSGFALAALLGLVLAIGIVHSKFLERTVYTLLVGLNSVPKVALAPLFVIWMGTGTEPKIAIAILLAIFSIVIDAVLGLRSVDPDMLHLARISRAPMWMILLKIRLPNALPSIFAGLKVAISFALVGAIVGEFVAGSGGLGFAILTAQGQFDTPRVFVCLFLLGILGTGLFYLVEILERLALPWHVSQRGNAAAH
ncbi:ABC transporter permease [Bordetella genomosp. 10]|uniref:ABC transporter permease n=1 Tax=Bordetella genomosp. 10 TaxID=1416804 RepID=A0A261S2Y0_9BORD|nr:ABC transporter permease [Bordetella genomosp. 10]OZI31150.1 ABC transporter permease [Bordetella genomosp. 10]